MEVRICPACGKGHVLPYFCRECWTQAGHEGQRAFYAEYCDARERGVRNMIERLQDASVSAAAR